MASKNVIDEYFIKISADAKGVNDDVNKALEKIFANSKKMNDKLSALEVKLKGKTLADKEKLDKRRNAAKNKRYKAKAELKKQKRLQEEKDLVNARKDLDKRLQLYKKDKSAFLNTKQEQKKISDSNFKSQVNSLTTKNNKDVKEMKSYYSKLEKESIKSQREFIKGKEKQKTQSDNLFKTQINNLTKKNDKAISEMRSYYSELEKQANSNFHKSLSAKKKEKLASDKHFKESVERITSKNKKEIDDMRSYYRSLERQSEKGKKAHAETEEAKTAKTKKEIKERDRYATKINSLKRTDYWDNIKSVNPRRSRSFENELMEKASKRDMEGIKNTAREMQKYSKEVSRSMKKVSFVQRGVTDSTRNMIRSYISLFAVFEGTRAIKNVGQDFQGMEASMLAAAGSSSAAANDMRFINGMVDQMGLSLKDTTDAWVKFKFAAKGKITQGEQEELFQNLSMFGTALKVDPESMKRSQKALIQIDEYCLAA